jgi:hypothetical protein
MIKLLSISCKVETKKLKSSFLCAKWKKRFCVLTTDEFGSPIFQVYKIRGVESVKFAFQINLKPEIEAKSFIINNKYCFSFFEETFACFDAQERDNWMLDINELLKNNISSINTFQSKYLVYNIVIHIYPDAKII